MGEDKKSGPLMQECIDNNAEASCKQDIKKAQDNNENGRFVPDANGPGVCSTPIWLCNGLQYSSEADYSSTSCSENDKCGDPPIPKCKLEDYRKSRAGKRRCGAWAECMGYN